MSDDTSVPNVGYRGSRFGRYGRISTRMDPDTRRLMLFAGGLAGVLGCLIGASTLMGHRTPGAVPVVMADPRPLRVKPDNPGGLQIDGAENDVFSAGADNGRSKLAPAAEIPNPEGMRAAAVVPASPLPKAPAMTASAVEPPVTIMPPPVPPGALATGASSRPSVVAPSKPAVVATAGAPVNAAPVAARSTPVSAVPAASRPTPVSAVPAASRPTPVSAVPAASRPTMVQLAALTTEQAARDEWQQLAKRMPDLISGRQPSVSKAERDGHTFWRLRTAGFADVSQAKTFCEQVRSKGGGCSVAEF